MRKHRSHAAKRQMAAYAGSQSSGRKAYQSQILPLHSNAPSEKKDPPFLAWPSHLFDMMLMPLRSFTPRQTWKASWNGLTPLEAWIENSRNNDNSVVPKTESKETASAYLYRVELPDISRDKIALRIHNRTLILNVEEAENQIKRSSRYQPSRSLRCVFAVPAYTNSAATKAELKSGILTITVPKTDTLGAVQSRTIPIV